MLCGKLSVRSGAPWSPLLSEPRGSGRRPALTQDAKLEVFGPLPDGIRGDAGVVTRTRQVGPDDPQEGSVWRGVVGVSPCQRPAIFEPRDLGLRVACKEQERQTRPFRRL